MRFISDIHGDIDYYAETALNSKQSVQVGDFGIGFIKNLDEVDAFFENHPQHTFIRGNHDNPALCYGTIGHIKEGTYTDDDIFFVGGAWSIDHAFRREGISWWRDEELSYEQLYKLIEKYAKDKPRIMCTHDFPIQAAKEMFFASGLIRGPQYKTRTSLALQEMFEIHQPELWVGGHWHFDTQCIIGRTHFVCMRDLSYIDVDLTTLEFTRGA